MSNVQTEPINESLVVSAETAVTTIPNIDTNTAGHLLVDDTQEFAVAAKAPAVTAIPNIDTKTSGSFPVDDEFINTYYSLFSGRTDQVGQGDSLSTPVSSVDEILAFVEDHLNGKVRLGLYNLLPDVTCTWAMIECENHGSQPVEDPAKTSLEIVTYLRSHGIAAYRELSKNPSGTCYHIWIFFSRPVKAFKLLEGSRLFLSRTLGISVEIFPKGYDPNTIGNFVWMPLFGGTDIVDGKPGKGVNEGRTVFVDDNGHPYADQRAVIEGVERNSEEAFDIFLADYHISFSDSTGLALASHHSTENDVPKADLEKVRQCSFMKHCEDNAANLPEPYWYAWITNAIRCIGGREYIHEYSRKYARYSKSKTDKKIAHALADTGPMTHETIAGLGRKCDCPTKFKAPISRSYWRDVEAEIKRIKGINDTAEKAVELASLINYIGKSLDGIERDLYEAQLKKTFNLKQRSFQGESGPTPGAAKAYKINYDRPLTDILDELKDADFGDVFCARGVFTWFKEHEQARYFTDEAELHYIYHQGKLIPMADASSDFAALLLYHANISLATAFGRVTVQVMNAMAQEEGKRIKKNTWLETHQAQHSVYLNLKNEREELAKITPLGVELIPNGENVDSIFMHNTPSDKFQPVAFCALDSENLKNALELSEDLIIRHIPCPDYEKWFAYGWRLSYPLYDFTTAHFTLRLEGRHQSGKSSACKILSQSLYGKAFDTTSTVASMFSDAAINPLVMDENIERGDFYRDPGHADFYLIAATGGAKQKRDVGTASGLVLEKIRALLLSNGIEALGKSEQTSRLLVFECDRKSYNSHFTSAVLQKILEQRDVLLSANFILTSRVLARIKAGDWLGVLERLQSEYPDHAKNRMFEHLGIIILYLEEFFKAAGKAESVWDMLGNLMRTQEDRAIEEIVDSDPIIEALEILRRSAQKQYDYETRHKSLFDSSDKSRALTLDVTKLLTEVEYGKTSFKLQGRAKELLSAFSTALKVHTGRQFTINTGKTLSDRLKNIEPELKAHGYTLNIINDTHNGQKAYEFSWLQAENEPPPGCDYVI